jgi:hypothetical protein
MNAVPGFTAECSAYRTSRHYQVIAVFGANGGAIRPQVCSLTCLGRCRDDVCAGLTGDDRTNCQRTCETACGCSPPPPFSCSRLCCPSGWTHACAPLAV